MSYENFCKRANAAAERNGAFIKGFENDEDAGKFIAYCSDGTSIIGNSTSLKCTFRFNGRQYMGIL